MNKLTKVVLGLCAAMPMMAFAGWQVSQPEQANQPFFQAGPMASDKAGVPLSSNKDLPGKFKVLGKGAPVYTISLEPGTLQANLRRINGLLSQPWSVKWQAPKDYSVIGNASISGKDFYDVIGKVLKFYPVRAAFYKQNHVMAIVPRNAS